MIPNSSNKPIVIIGAGIAGMSLAYNLQKLGIDFKLFESLPSISENGMGFLIMGNGMRMFDKMGIGNQIRSQNMPVNCYNSINAEGTILNSSHMDDCIIMKRKTCVKEIYKRIDKSRVFFNKRLIDVEEVAGTDLVKLVFDDGTIEETTLVVGADGVRSQLKQYLFPLLDSEQADYKEIVGISNNKVYAQNHLYGFNKINCSDQGFNVGIIPCSEDSVIWFIQLNESIIQVPEGTKEDLLNFALSFAAKIPKEHAQLFDAESIENIFLWKMRDSDVLDSFYKNRIVLIGDACHPLLSLTSQGVNSALEDAYVLSRHISKETNPLEALRKYEYERKKVISEIIDGGRTLLDQFVNYDKYHDFHVPYIEETTRLNQLLSHPKEKVCEYVPSELYPKSSSKLRILYFTDPICSSCWGIEGQMRKLKLEYGHAYTIDYRMGGLLPSWVNFGEGGPINEPSDVAHHWNEASPNYRMPINGDIWLEDPLDSSYPPSIAYLAAKLQDRSKALKFLRRIKEMVFIYKKNTTHFDHLLNAAQFAGLDLERFEYDYHHYAKDLLSHDLALKRSLNVRGFPTMFVSNETDQIILYGTKRYHELEKAFKKLNPAISKRPITLSNEALFAKFGSMTTTEFEMLSQNIQDSALLELERLHKNRVIDKVEIHNGILWVNNLSKMRENAV